MKENIKVYNEDKTEILENYDLEKGYLVDDILKIHEDAVKGQKEEGHYEVIAEYDNGGKDVVWVVDKPYIESKPEYNGELAIKIYIKYSDDELLKLQYKKEIENLKRELASTDYEALKYAEGWFTEEEYSHIKNSREALRIKIRDLESKL